MITEDLVTVWHESMQICQWMSGNMCPYMLEHEVLTVLLEYRMSFASFIMSSSCVVKCWICKDSTIWLFLDFVCILLLLYYECYHHHQGQWCCHCHHPCLCCCYRHQIQTYGGALLCQCERKCVFFSILIITCHTGGHCSTAVMVFIVIFVSRLPASLSSSLLLLPLLASLSYCCNYYHHLVVAQSLP